MSRGPAHEALHLRTRDVAHQAAAAAAKDPGAKFIAGGTNLLDLMKLEIETRGI